jgi:hypothetical protein
MKAAPSVSSTKSGKSWPRSHRTHKYKLAKYGHRPLAFVVYLCNRLSKADKLSRHKKIKHYRPSRCFSADIDNGEERCAFE